MALAALTRTVEAERLRLPGAPRPASFVERGIAVPFTTPALGLSRLRRSTGREFEIVTPNLADGRGMYLIAWPALSQVMAPTMHDRVLYQEIVGGGALDPGAVRVAHLRTAARGFAGIDGAELASRTAAADAHLATAVNLALMVRLIHDGGVTASEAQQAVENGRAVLEYRRALDSVAARVATDARSLSDRIEAFSGSLAPLGLPEPGLPGRLRRTVARLAELQRGLAHWGTAEGGELGAIATLCSEAAGRTVECCRRVIAAIDRRLASLIATLRAWPSGWRGVDDARQQLAWLLDGWTRAIIGWDGVRDAARPRQHVALGIIFRGLPLLPAEADPAPGADDLARAHRRMMQRYCRRFDAPETSLAAVELARRAELANLYGEFV